MNELTAVEPALSDLRSEILDRVDEGFCICEMIVDTDGRAVDYRFLDVNPNFERMTGLVGAKGRTALELVPDLERSWIDTYARAGLNGETVRFEQRSEAMGRTFQVFAAPLSAPRCFAIVFKDVSRESELLEDLRASEARFREIADNLPLIVWLHGPTGEQEFVNQTFCDYFGVTREEMHADRWRLLTHPEDGSAYADAFLQAIKDQAHFHHGVRVKDALGRWRHLESWARPRFGPDGAFQGHVGCSADVTDRKEAQAKLVENEARLRTLINTTAVPVAFGDATGRIFNANDAFYEMLGFERNDRPVLDWRSLTPQDHHPADAVATDELGSAGVAEPFEKEFLRTDGTRVPVLVHLQRLPGTQENVAFAIDLTETREREHAVNLLLKEVNHRTKNLLGVIQSLVRQTANSTPPAAFAEAFARRLSGLAASQDLLIASDWRTVPIEDLARSQLDFLGEMVDQRVTLSGADVRIGPAAAQGVGMALHELATNALKHGALSNGAGRVAIAWSYDADRLAITWTETGGPRVSTPGRTGFGHTVIARMAAHSVGGEVELDFKPQGLYWRLEAPLDRIVSG
ncbi:MAG: PAS domain S-box protein [Oceanicaulis sp.]